MNHQKFYTTYSSEDSCLQIFKHHYEKKLTHCSKCGNNKLTWSNSFHGWRCSKCSKKYSLKSISFMKDSNKSFKDWWEIIHLICHSKKSYSINEIYRISQQTRYETVYHMVLKIRQEMGKINQIESSQYYTPIRFDKRKQSRQNYTRMTPYHLIVTYKKTKGRKQDKIRLTLSKSGRKKLILALKKCSSNYPFPKLLHANNTLKTTELKCLEKCPILPKWENKLRNNIIKLIKGTYHQLQTLHLQGVLDEYSFKYNYRYALNTKGELFISKALIYL